MGLSRYEILEKLVTLIQQVHWRSAFQTVQISNAIGCKPHNQVSTNRGPDLTFAVEAKIKSLCHKSSRGSILKSQNRVYTKHEYQPGSKMVEYLMVFDAYTNLCYEINIRACNKSAKLEARIVKADF